ncbi:SOS response-associated peptidase [Neotamlana laminarinivorans]|uniref:Abasic site processing protein n=1 Tax=Neotamlana laminarinivorans TaxID=2883124 RepID=A0A9X1I4E6_9FLAO|nr:SOS response-associated peptidase family protein [Tamlana laminarinivorans]MCB4800242.1 SOS response-associated peptidase [Tamlana laminarinivorans]
MCFHTTTTAKTNTLEKHFKVKLSSENLRQIFDKPQYHLNGFSHPNMLVIPQQNKEVFAPGVWGIVPSDKPSNQILDYYKGAVKYGGGLNARSEKLTSHFIYKEAIHQQRCIIPVTGFFEPHDHNKKKYPVFIKDKKEQPLALAGIYTVIDTYITFAIITKEASPLLTKVHNLKKRQPLMLDQELANQWLQPNLNENDITDITKYNYPDSHLKAYTVSKDLFSPKVDSNYKEISDEVQYEGVNFN